MRKMILTITALLCAVMLASCGGGRVVCESVSPRTASTGRTWTVLVYLCGGSEESETGSASKKLEEIMSVSYPENVTVLVETGGSREWHEKGVYSDYLQRFEAGYGTLYLADQALMANMGDYRTLADFLTWGMANYKADNYALILSGSGGGSMYGMCEDEQFENDCLSLAEISYAMSSAGKNIEFTCMDASLMGTLETAGALTTYTDYLVAPQDLLAPDGLDYASLVSCICENPSSTGEEIGRAVCDSYYARALKNGNEKNAAMSVIDMSKISTLNQAFDGMAGDMAAATDSFDSYRGLASALSGAHIYGGATEDEGFSDIIDLGDAATRGAQYIGGTADMLIEALNDTIAYRVCGGNQSGSSGMGVFYPLDMNSDILQQYMDMSLSSKYREFLRKICISCSVTDSVTNTPDYTSSWAWATYNDDMSWLEYKSVLDGNTYELDILGNMDLFTDVTMNVYKLDKKSGEYVYAGKYKNLASDWEAGIFRDNFDGILPRFAGKDMSMSLVRSYDGYEIYSIPVILNGVRSNVRVKYDREADQYEIIGAWGGLDEKGQAKDALIRLGAFDRITPLLAVYDEEHTSRDYITGALGLKLGRGVKESHAGDGSYIFEYEINDVYGHKRWGTPVNAKISGGRTIFE